LEITDRAEKKVMNTISPTVWKLLGVLQIAGGILLWLPTFKKYVAGFFILFMLFFTIFHIVENTYDVGGAVFMAFLLGLLVWNPAFLKGKGKYKERIIDFIILLFLQNGE